MREKIARAGGRGGASQIEGKHRSDRALYLMTPEKEALGFEIPGFCYGCDQISHPIKDIAPDQWAEKVRGKEGCRKSVIGILIPDHRALPTDHSFLLYCSENQIALSICLTFRLAGRGEYPLLMERMDRCGEQ